jgi:hypothetical protein
MKDKDTVINYDEFTLKMIRGTNSDSPFKAVVAKLKSAVEKISQKKTGGSSAGTDSHGH